MINTYSYSLCAGIGYPGSGLATTFRPEGCTFSVVEVRTDVTE
jgi:hypothetical protein